MLYKYIQIDITYKTILSLRLISLFPAVQSQYLVQLCLVKQTNNDILYRKRIPEWLRLWQLELLRN